ncbi:MAG: preprotein translocase subunit YajC [Rhodocyclaceae bacterium]|nr:preprotein translocase subunit YajC [Rhodocyclaceae bacterium]
MLISNAYAQAAEGAAQDPTGGLVQLLPMILMFVVIWFLMIRPQMKRAKEHKAMVEALGKGDEVITQGGMAGRITEVGEQFVQVEVADKVQIMIQRQAVATVLPKGTLKDA